MANKLDGYFLAQDNDCHWYIVPRTKEGEWNVWQNLDSEDEKSWTVPLFARKVGGSPSLVTFFNYTL